MRLQERLIILGILIAAMLAFIALNAWGIAFILLLVFLGLSGIIVIWWIFLLLLVVFGIAFLFIAPAIPGGVNYWPLIPILAAIATAFEAYRLGKIPTGITLTKKESEKQERARKYAEDVLKEAKKEKDR